MDEFESLSHSKWECKYHIVFIPKFRRKVPFYGMPRKVFRKTAEHREGRVKEEHLLPDHVRIIVSIPPKYAVSQCLSDEILNHVSRL